MKLTALVGLAILGGVVLGVLILPLGSCTDNSRILQARIDSLQNELKKYAEERATVEARLIKFDTLDFEVFTHQKWDRLGESHADNIVVNWPDSRQTKDIATHIEDLKGMFVFAPDTRVLEHPIRFGSGDYTCVTGNMMGTFSKPMPIGKGKSIKPTGKAFNVSMCTVGHWQNGRMIEESLFWDNQAFMKQIGLVK